MGRQERTRKKRKGRQERRQLSSGIEAPDSSDHGKLPGREGGPGMWKEREGAGGSRGECLLSGVLLGEKRKRVEEWKKEEGMGLYRGKRKEKNWRGMKVGK